MGFSFRPATRQQVGLIVGLAGPSGSGKTFSAMRLAAGIAATTGKRFAVIDTEGGRALHYADLLPFDHGDLKPPFSPMAYAEAIKAADEASYPVIVVDSVSHEHAGEGGILDMQEAELESMAGKDWQKRERVKMAAWIKPKAAHKRFVNQLLQVRAHLILCFRAEQKVDITRGQDGKMQVVPKTIMSGFSDWIPIAEKNLLYELTASFLLTPDHPGVPKPIKLQAQHRDLFPLGQEITEKAGERLADWAHGGGDPRADVGPAREETPPGRAGVSQPEPTFTLATSGPPARGETGGVPIEPMDLYRTALPRHPPADWEILASDFCARFDEATTREEAETWRARWMAKRKTIPIKGQAAVQTAINRAKARLRP